MMHIMIPDVRILGTIFADSFIGGYRSKFPTVEIVVQSQKSSYTCLFCLIQVRYTDS